MLEGLFIVGGIHAYNEFIDIVLMYIENGTMNSL